MQKPGWALQGLGYSQYVFWTGQKGCEVNGTLYQVGITGVQALEPTGTEFPLGLSPSALWNSGGHLRSQGAFEPL